GERRGVGGESGCGKSVTALSIMRLQRPGRIVSGRVLLKGQDLTRMSEYEMRELRGRETAMIFQAPMTSLNPVYRVGWQVAEPTRLHHGWDAKRALSGAVNMLGRVGIPAPESRARDYPHQFSGGMRQRVMIAMGLTTTPEVLIADEPTTALDVTIQAQILELLRHVNREFGTATILITHNLGVVAGMCKRVVVMYAGRIVEAGPTKDVFAHPKHPYTWSLLRSIPRLDAEQHEPIKRAWTSVEPLVSVSDLKVWCPVSSGVMQRTTGHVHAVDGVDLEIKAGETVGLVGESGCGKSTLGRAVIRLLEPTGGTVSFK